MLPTLPGPGNCPCQVKLPAPGKLTTWKDRMGGTPPLCSQQDLGLHPNHALVTQFCLLLKQTNFANCRRQPRAETVRMCVSFRKEARPAPPGHWTRCLAVRLLFLRVSEYL